MSECKIQQHTQFHIIVDASGLQLNQSIIETGQAGGIYGNEHAKITLKNTTIREVDSHHLYINNARLFVENSTLSHIVGNGITCIDAILKLSIVILSMLVRALMPSFGLINQWGVLRIVWSK